MGNLTWETASWISDDFNMAVFWWYGLHIPIFTEVERIIIELTSDRVSQFLTTEISLSNKKLTNHPENT